ncbi:MAG: DUF1071 domain-containing protein [Clostridia bacterium]|nr:DUF1071 domain-containing protein [Clostridia bacterium]
MEKEEVLQTESLFSRLCKIDVSDYVETKKSGSTELTYLSWANAWKNFKEQCPSADYEIRHWEGKPYLYDEVLGYMVETSVTVDGDTKTMWLPVMDNTNRAMKSHTYTYKVKQYVNGKWTGDYDEKEVPAATMFDINTAIMRCLVKNMGMFGLGLYIYAGEDIPEGETVKKGSKARFEKPSVEEIIKGIEEKMTLDNAKVFYAKAIGHYGKETPEYKTWIKVWADKKDALEKAKTKAELDADFKAIESL